MRCSTRINLRIEDLGKVEYDKWRTYLKEVFESVRKGEFDAWVQFCEHPRVLTIGKAGVGKGFKREPHWPCLSVDRGGKITAHFPGQLMVYPTVNLRRLSLGVREWLREFLSIIRAVLRDMGVDLEERNSGLWSTSGKVVSFGMAVRQFVAYHGAGIVYELDEEVNDLIWPCGEDGRLSSLSELGLVSDDLRQELVLKVSERLTSFFTSLGLRGKID